MKFKNFQKSLLESEDIKNSQIKTLGLTHLSHDIWENKSHVKYVWWKHLNKFMETDDKVIKGMKKSAGGGGEDFTKTPEYAKNVEKLKQHNDSGIPYSEYATDSFKKLVKEIDDLGFMNVFVRQEIDKKSSSKKLEKEIKLAIKQHTKYSHQEGSSIIHIGVVNSMYNLLAELRKGVLKESEEFLKESQNSREDQAKTKGLTHIGHGVYTDKNDWKWEFKQTGSKINQGHFDKIQSIDQLKRYDDETKKKYPLPDPETKEEINKNWIENHTDPKQIAKSVKYGNDLRDKNDPEYKERTNKILDRIELQFKKARPLGLSYKKDGMWKDEIGEEWVWSDKFEVFNKKENLESIFNKEFGKLDNKKIRNEKAKKLDLEYLGLEFYAKGDKTFKWDSEKEDFVPVNIKGAKIVSGNPAYGKPTFNIGKPERKEKWAGDSH